MLHTKPTLIPEELLMRSYNIPRPEQIRILFEDRENYAYAFWNVSLFICSEEDKDPSEKDYKWLDLLDTAYTAITRGNSRTLIKILRKMQSHLGVSGIVPVVITQ